MPLKLYLYIDYQMNKTIIGFVVLKSKRDSTQSLYN